MSSRLPKAFDYALRAVRRDARRHGADPAAVARGSRHAESLVRRELDSFRRGQGLAYWHHDHH